MYVSNSPRISRNCLKETILFSGYFDAIIINLISLVSKSMDLSAKVLCNSLGIYKNTSIDKSNSFTESIYKGNSLVFL